MDNKIVDARALSCPQPVIAAKKATDAGEPFDILLDNEVSRENVLRFARQSGWSTKVREDGPDIVVFVYKMIRNLKIYTNNE